MKFIYEQNYKTKLFIVCIISIILCILDHSANYVLIPMPQTNIPDYHFNILTINSILSGFALTNLGILLTISDAHIIKKLEGTDILRKRNIVIGHAIIFGAISIFISIFWVLEVNFEVLSERIGKPQFLLFQEFWFYIEILSLIISVSYFLLSAEKMIRLLNILYMPKNQYSDKKVEELKGKVFKKKK